MWLGYPLYLALAILITVGQLSGADCMHVLAEPPAGKFYNGVFPGGKNGMGADITSRSVCWLMWRLDLESTARIVR
jgi:hypothetical protein